MIIIIKKKINQQWLMIEWYKQIKFGIGISLFPFLLNAR